MSKLRVPKEELKSVYKHQLTIENLALKTLSDEDEKRYDTGLQIFENHSNEFKASSIRIDLYDDDETRKAAIDSLDFLSDQEKKDYAEYFIAIIQDLERTYLRMKYKTSYVTLEMYEETFGGL